MTVAREQALPIETVVEPTPSTLRRWALGVARFARRKPLGAFGAVIFILVIVVAVFSPWIARYPIAEPHFSDALQAPNNTYWFGTDALGQDFFSRMVIATQVPVLVGIGAVILAAILSLLVGGISAYLGGKADLVTQRIVDVWVALPPIFLLITFLSVLGTGGDGFLGLGRGPHVALDPNNGDWIWYTFFRTTVVIFSLGIIFAGYGARIVRGAVLGIKENVYIDAARALGASNLRIMLRHVLPNIMPLVIVLASINLGAAVLAEATVSFLGFGILRPFPTWGQLLDQDGRVYGVGHEWLSIIPGLAIFICVYAFNMLGDALRDVLDPRLRGGR
jgi:peptide/nickel transport system permease protein